jgi:tripartite-type tricarboxylate transporter receptor subunit TctC
MKLLKAVVFAALGACLSVTAAAQGFPVKPIRVIVQFPPGNGADINARMLAQQLSVSLGQQVVVENRPGAAGVAAVQAVARADPDGYTLLHMANVNAISQSLFKTAPYDIVGQFAPISTVSFTPMLFVTAKGSKYATFKELVASATGNPGRFTIGVGVLGSTQHLVAELFKSTTKQNLTIVPFNSAGNLLSAVGRGEVDVAIDLITPLLSPLRGGAYKALAISSEKRFAGLPDVPTLIETGFVDYPVQSWGMIGAPAKTPAAIVGRLSRESIAALAQPEIQKRAHDMGITVAGSTPAEARDLLVAEIARWRGVIQAAGIQRQ